MKRENSNPFESLRKLSKPKTKRNERKTEELNFKFVTGKVLEPAIDCGLKFLKLENLEYFAFQGQAEIAVLKGDVEIAGLKVLEPRFHAVISPATNSLATVYCRGPSPAISLENLTKAQEQAVNEVLEKCREAAAVLAIRPLHNNLIGLERMLPIFRNVFGAGNGLVPGFNPVAAEGQPIFTICPQMVSASSAILSEAKSTCLVGNQNTGKSSFGRFLINQYLSNGTKVAYLDCDVGQPEFTPPGMLSLTIVSSPILGPPFSHQIKPHASRFYGFVSPKNNPDGYLDLIFELLECYMKEFSDIPLVCNTCGWIRGVGLDILQHLLNRVSPTHVLWTRNSDFSKDSAVESVFPQDCSVLPVQMVNESEISK